jgi:hypothetical protein
MKIETMVDSKLDTLRNRTTEPPDVLEEQWGLAFITRVYRTSLLVWAVMALLIGSRFGLASFIGLSIGAALALGSLRLIELTVRALVRPDAQVSTRQFTLVLFLKLPLLTVIMLGVVRAVMDGYANVFAFVGGVALVHAVIVLKAVGRWVIAPMPAEARLAAREPWVARLLAAARAGAHGPAPEGEPVSLGGRRPSDRREPATGAQRRRGLAPTGTHVTPVKPIWTEQPPLAESAD